MGEKKKMTVAAGTHCWYPPQSSKESGRPKEALKGDAAAEKESTVSTVVIEQLNFLKGMYSGKMFLKHGLTKLDRKMVGQR